MNPFLPVLIENSCESLDQRVITLRATDAAGVRLVPSQPRMLRG